MTRISSLSERPGSDGPRRLSDWLKPTDSKKVHSLVDKVYQRKNLQLAWGRVRENRGAGGIDGQSLKEFEEQLVEQLDRLHEELKSDSYRPLPVRQRLIPKPGQPGKFRPLARISSLPRIARLWSVWPPPFDVPVSPLPASTMTAIAARSSTAPARGRGSPWMPWTGLPGSARTSPIETGTRFVIMAVTPAPHVGNDGSSRKPSTAPIPRTAPLRRSPRPSASAAGAVAAGLVCSARSMTSIPCAVLAAALCA